MDCLDDPKTAKRCRCKGRGLRWSSSGVGSTSVRSGGGKTTLRYYNFYRRQDRDFTIDNNNTVKRVVKEAISQQELPEPAISLFADRPSKFYE